LFRPIFTVFPSLVTFSILTVAAAYIKWFISVISVSFYFKSSSIIPFISFLSHIIFYQFWQPLSFTHYYYYIKGAVVAQSV
jgi:hypothetical protein